MSEFVVNDLSFTHTVAIVGFEQTTYTFSETAGMVEVCFIINDGDFPLGYALPDLNSADGSAVGKDQMQVKACQHPPSIPPTTTTTTENY